jgi:preprotein translocase SecE subunit
MAEAKKSKPSIGKKRETIRERADKSAARSARAPRTRKFASAVGRPVGKVRSALKKEYTPLKTGDSKVGKFLGRRSRFTPMYFIDSVREMRKVSWPSRRQVASLTLAVFMFSFFLSAIIKAMDYGFDKLFKNVILK